MNSSQLKYGEIFCFLALFFLIIILFFSKKSSQNEITKGQNDFPPIITINNAQFPFDVGQATLTTKLKTYIANEVVPKILNDFPKYKVNTIEVIGHTDGLKIDYQKNSNLDEILIQVAQEENKDIGDLKAGSNADLGLMRALAVIKELQKTKKLSQLFRKKGIDEKKVFRAYSAAQLYLPNRKIAPPDSKANQERRRIQIRFTRLDDE
ncbi:MAG: hypothetical protein V7L02_16180 [Nostoc sp.]|uniref:hypothetical protein n=1 Tax=Nostoc sp. TaxID=1180 RepID=UPI002FFCF650